MATNSMTTLQIKWALTGGRTIHTGRYLGNARKGALLQQGVMAGYIAANRF